MKQGGPRTRIALKVQGMDCAEEVAALRGTVGRLPGVHELHFDLLHGKIIVEADPETVRTPEILKAVERAGLKAQPWDKAFSGAGDAPPEGFWQRRGRLATCLASGVFLTAGFVSHAISEGSLFAALSFSERGREAVFPLASVLLYGASVLLGAWYVAPKAFQAARRLSPDMNLLMLLAVAGAVALGEWFEAAMVTFLFALALLLESWSVAHARRAITALMDLSPKMASQVLPDSGRVEERPVGEIPEGATALVRPGEKIPLDGRITKGFTTVNQAAITGESIPVAKAVGDEIFAGTLNGDGAFEFVVTRQAEDTTMARIIHLVEEAQSRRAPSEQWVDRFARVYTPCMLILALLIALAPPLLFGGPWDRWFYQALVILVIACPCALVISTPVSVVGGLAAAARNGVLIKGGAYLEAPARLRAVAIDKTGTLTHGRPEVQSIVAFQGCAPKVILSIAASLESLSGHPLSGAVMRRAASDGVPFASAEDFQSIQGKGAEGRIDGRLYWIGSHRLMHEKGQETREIHDKAEELEDAGHSVVIVGDQNHVCGLISIADSVRPHAAQAIAALKSAGVRHVELLTGDNEGTARAVAAATGVDAYKAELLPADKALAVESLVKTFGHVAMVGDGVNDAPAMAAARLGIAMGVAGTDVAIETADVALMSDDLSKIPWLVRHSRRTLRIIRQNIAFALLVKAAFMGLALAGLATLWMAITADMGASLLVIFNSLRLLDAKSEEAVSCQLSAVSPHPVPRGN